MSLVRQAIGIFALATAFWSAAAGAATVAIVRPTKAPPLMTETLGRIRGELTSVGFTTQFIDEPVADGVDEQHASRAWLEQLVIGGGFDAVVAILSAASPDSVEVWVVDRVTRKTMVRTVHLGPIDERTPEVLSVRTIELLRSSFLEIEMTSNEPLNGASEAPPVVVQFLEKERLKVRPERLAVELGALGVVSLDGVGPALLPLVRVDWALPSSLVAHVTLAGLGTRPKVDNHEGSAQISQAYGTLGACYSFDVHPTVQPFLAFSAGVLRTAVDGRSESPLNRGRQTDGWSFLLDGGAGAWIRPGDRLFLSLAVRTQMAQPRPTIRFVGEVVATSASPNLAIDFAIGAWL